jgi:hypothetical protein
LVSSTPLVGNIVTDAMRTTYGADFGDHNSGGLRADLTCPTTDNAGDFCPPYTPPPFPITRGQALSVLDQVVADHITATTPISPMIQGRITCTTSGATPCPVVVP